jgi:segregation and condensation protein B
MLRPSAALEAILFASGEPLEKKDVMKLLGMGEDELKAALGELEMALASRGVALIETTTELELRTAPAAAELVTKLRESELARDLGKASLETLAVIAYHEGASRSEIDWVRGVNSSASMRTLLLRGLIKGKEDAADKRRIRYSLTPEALAHLGLGRVEDLPRYSELRAAAQSLVRGESAAATAL